MRWTVVGPDIYGRAIYRADISSMCWATVQEFDGRWAWELNMPDARDDHRGRTMTKAEAFERVATSALQRGMIRSPEHEQQREERMSIETENAAQLESLAVLARADATLARSRRWDSLTGVDDAVEHAVAKERAAVVAWLREAAYTTLYDARAWDVADAIERGEHRREEEP
jgi:hypothetical protein